METILFRCMGHPNILATHKSTIEITTDKELSLKGDCIIGIKSTQNLFLLSDKIKALIQRPSSVIKVTLTHGTCQEVISGRGHPDLTLEDETAIVIRKSNFTCSRTLMIQSDKAAIDISRKIINNMRHHDSVMEVLISIHDSSSLSSKQA